MSKKISNYEQITQEKIDNLNKIATVLEADNQRIKEERREMTRTIKKWK